MDTMLKNILNKAKVLIFDLEGTLLEMPVDWEGMRNKIRSYFSDNFGIDMHFKPVLEKIDEALSLLAQTKAKSEIDRIKEQALSILESAHIEGAKKSVLYPGIFDLLEKLEKKNYILTVFTNSGKESTTILLEKNKINDYFKMIVTREDVDKPKPSPEGIEKIIKAFKLTRENYLVIGDHPYDILAGKAAKIRSVGLLSGISKKEDLLRVKADFILEKAINLAQFLE